MKILNFGSCNIDYVYSLEHIIKNGETLSSDDLKIFPGGKGLNQSIALSRAGAKVYHAGCIGSNGGILTDILLSNGVDTSYINNVNEMNGHAIIQVSREGDNSIFLYSGSNSMITKEQVDSVLSHFEKGDIILLQNEINNIEYIIDSAYRIGMCIVLNPSPISKNIFEIDFNRISYLILNEVEAKDISGYSEPEESLEYFKVNYPELKIVLTLGKHGCIYQDSESSYYHPVFETNAVDTTAAGDTFTGYFVAGISKGNILEDILKTASCASAITVSRHGAAPSIPTLAEVNAAKDVMKVKDVNRKQEKLRKAIDEYIDSNITEASLEGLSKALDYSVVYTGNIVKNVTGFTFMEYLQEKRLKISSRLLKETELSVGEIIKSVGYENESFFRKKFKLKYKCNPLEYRKNYMR